MGFTQVAFLTLTLSDNAASLLIIMRQTFVSSLVHCSSSALAQAWGEADGSFTVTGTAGFKPVEQVLSLAPVVLHIESLVKLPCTAFSRLSLPSTLEQQSSCKMRLKPSKMRSCGGRQSLPEAHHREFENVCWLVVCILVDGHWSLCIISGS